MARPIKKIKSIIEKLMNQMAGEVDSDELLVPEYGINGTGDLYCLEYNARSYVKISRGQKAYMLDDNRDDLNRVLIYTTCGRIIEIDIDELIYTEFD